MATSSHRPAQFAVLWVVLSDRTINAVRVGEHVMADRPSLFCFEVYKHDGWEKEMVIDQFTRKKSIFACDDHMLISDNNYTFPASHDDRSLSSVGIGKLDVKIGRGLSWANAAIFIEAWEAVVADSRYTQHDWVVKVDPDTVFRPLSLKRHLSQSKVSGSAFFKNFHLDSYPVVGAIEVASREAVRDMARGLASQKPRFSFSLLGVRVEPFALFDALLGDRECARMAFYAAEDDWFTRCLKSVGATMKEDTALLQHLDVPADNKCGDPWWVALHPYKNVTAYRWCEDQVKE